VAPDGLPGRGSTAPPANTLVGVPALTAPDWLIEIELVAVAD
jgi:enamine deaminase RidA (YjgF/YER057c/UK114 family)